MFGTNVWVEYTGIEKNKWQHVAMTFNDSHYNIYWNGQQVISTTAYADDHIFNQSNIDISIGGNPTSSEYFEGWIDDVRAYNRSLTLSEIQIIYNSGFENGTAVSTNDASLMAYYTLNSTYNDQSGHGIDLTNSGTVEQTSWTDTAQNGVLTSGIISTDTSYDLTSFNGSYVGDRSDSPIDYYTWNVSATNEQWDVRSYTSPFPQMSLLDNGSVTYGNGAKVTYDGQFVSASDSSLKENIQNLDLTGRDLTSLAPKSYKYKDKTIKKIVDKKEVNVTIEGHEAFGLTCEDVKPIFPECTETIMAGREEKCGVIYDCFIPILIKHCMIDKKC